MKTLAIIGLGLISLPTTWPVCADDYDRNWRGTQTLVTKAAVVPVKSISATDSANSTRNSVSKLQMAGTGSRSAKFAASPSTATGIWIVDGKSAGSGNAITYTLSRGSHSVGFTGGGMCLGLTTEVLDGNAVTKEIGTSPNIQALTDFVRQLNRNLKQDDAKVVVTVTASTKTYKVDVKSSPLCADSKELSVGGKATLSLIRAYVPGWSIPPIPLVKGGVYVTPSVSVAPSIALKRDATINPSKCSGTASITVTGTVEAGLGLTAGDGRVLKVDCTASGSVSVTGKATYTYPNLKLTASVGKLDVGYRVTVTRSDRTLLNYSSTYNVWAGMPYSSTVDMSTLF